MFELRREAAAVVPEAQGREEEPGLYAEAYQRHTFTYRRCTAEASRTQSVRGLIEVTTIIIRAEPTNSTGPGCERTPAQAAGQPSSRCTRTFVCAAERAVRMARTHVACCREQGGRTRARQLGISRERQRVEYWEQLGEPSTSTPGCAQGDTAIDRCVLRGRHLSVHGRTRGRIRRCCVSDSPIGHHVLRS